MVLISANDGFDANLTEIQQEHKRLVGLLNELDGARNNAGGKDVLESVLIDLINHAATHFRTEERYFAQLGYPEMDSHKREHAAFLCKCMIFIQDFEQGNATLTTDVTCFLGNWWKDHVMGADKKYYKFLNDKGLKQTV